MPLFHTNALTAVGRLLNVLNILNILQFLLLKRREECSELQITELQIFLKKNVKDLLLKDREECRELPIEVLHDLRYWTEP